MEAVLNALKDKDVRIYNKLVADECDDLETFLSLNNDDYIRLEFTTKMIRAIQEAQRGCENELPVEELFVNAPNAQEALPDSPAPADGNIYSGIDLEKLIDVKDIFVKTPTGQHIIERLEDCNACVDDNLLKDITHTLCAFLAEVYGLRPSVFYKDNLARSLVRTYPCLASSVVPEVPQSLWFHKHARGRNKHAGKLYYRMETLSKKSGERVIVRPSKHAPQQHELQPTSASEPETSSLTELLSDLQFIVPSQDTKTQIFELWKQTFSYRNEQRAAGTFLQFLKDYPQSLAFGGVLIDEDFILSHPNCKEFDLLWDDLETKLLITYKLFPLVKHNFIRALAILREKNPTKGRKNMKDKDARKANPLHGVIDWVQCKEDITACDVPQLFVVAKEFEEGDCFLVWNDLLIPLDGGIRAGFVLLLKSFSTFGVKSVPSDAAFFSFFFSIIYGIERPSTTANKICIQLK